MHLTTKQTLEFSKARDDLVGPVFVGTGKKTTRFVAGYLFRKALQDGLFAASFCSHEAYGY